MTDQILDNQETVVVDTPEPPKYNEVEQEAIQSGWVPKDEWKGSEDDWVPAKQFVKRGQLEAELKRQRADGAHKEKVIKSMKDYYLNLKEDAKKEVLDSLKRSHREAIKSEDYVEATKISLQMEEMEDNLDRKFKQHDEQVAQVTAPVHTPPPEFFEWQNRNSWYKMGQDDEMTIEADQLAVAFAKRNPNKDYIEMLNYVTERMTKMYPEKFMTKQKERVADDVNEPGSVQSKGDNRSKTKLSPAEKEAAAAFGLTEQEYAEGLRELDKKKGWA
jgi:hypothetical protein